MGGYGQHALDSASAVDLVVALYDGIIRFLYAACDAVDRGDETARRASVKRALDIILHLQARLRTDINGAPANASMRANCPPPNTPTTARRALTADADRRDRAHPGFALRDTDPAPRPVPGHAVQIGRATCRERV